MIDRLDSFSWEQAFGYAGEPGTYASEGGHARHPRSVECDAASEDPFTREDVSVIYWAEEGVNDDCPWRIAGRLRDGRYFYLEAGCDCTGWDCSAYGWAKVAIDPDIFVAMCLTDSVRNDVRRGMRWTHRAP